MGKVTIFLNQKGGVAKTTSCYNIAVATALSHPGQNVLMIDLDPQADLTDAAGLLDDLDTLGGHSTCDLFDPKKDPLDAVFDVPATGLDNLYIVPSDITLAETERNLILALNGHAKLKKAIDKIRRHFKFIYIDCPPQLGQLSINALVAADELIIPCKTDHLSYRGVAALLDTVQQIKDEELNENIKIAGIIGTMYTERIKANRAVVEEMKSTLPLLGTVRMSADVNRNDASHVPVVMAMPRTIVAAEYNAIADKLAPVDDSSITIRS